MKKSEIFQHPEGCRGEQTEVRQEEQGQDQPGQGESSSPRQQGVESSGDGQPRQRENVVCNSYLELSSAPAGRRG